TWPMSPGLAQVWLQARIPTLLLTPMATSPSAAHLRSQYSRRPWRMSLPALTAPGAPILASLGRADKVVNAYIGYLLLLYLSSWLGRIWSYGNGTAIDTWKRIHFWL